MKLRDMRRDELTLKDMSTLREGASAVNQHSKTTASIRDYSLQHSVHMGWGDTFKEIKRDFRPFCLKLDAQEYILSWAELKEMDTAGFFRREEGNPSRYKLRYFDGSKFILDTELNEEAQRDMIFRLVGDEFEVLLDWYEVSRAGRFV